MKIRSIALIGGLFAVVGGMGAVACSSSNTGNPTTPGDDGGSNTKPDTGVVSGDDSGQQQQGDDAGNTPTPDGGGTTDTSCKSPTLHPPTPDGGIFCPYSYDDAGELQYCNNGTQECCVSAGGDAGGSSGCQAFDGTGTSFNGGTAGCPSGDTVWQCDSPADCVTGTFGPTLPIDGGAPTTGATVCCLVGGSLESAKAPYCTTANKTFFGGTMCEPASACTGSINVVTSTFSGADPLYTVCETQADCATGTCTPIYVSGTPIGVCLPQQ